MGNRIFQYMAYSGVYSPLYVDGTSNISMIGFPYTKADGLSAIDDVLTVVLNDLFDVLHRNNIFKSSCCLEYLSDTVECRVVIKMQFNIKFYTLTLDDHSLLIEYDNYEEVLLKYCDYTVDALCATLDFVGIPHKGSRHVAAC